MTVSTTVGVRLETTCVSAMCNQFSRPLLEQMDSGRYDRVSLMPIPDDVDEWLAAHRTARKRSNRAAARGYRFGVVERHLHNQDIYDINTSAPERQGRPMANGYTQPVSFTPLPVYPCDRHAVRTYGVKNPYGQLVAYLWLYRAGDLALVSQILGHADHLRNEVMFLLWHGMLGAESMVDPDGFVVYNRHDSGTAGLREFKERVGLEEVAVEWLP